MGETKLKRPFASKIRLIVGPHTVGVKFSANGNIVLLALVLGSCSGLAMKDDALGVRVDQCTVLYLPREVEFGANLVFAGSFDELDRLQIKWQSVGKFEKHRVVQIFLGIAEDAELLRAFDGDNEIW